MKKTLFSLIALLAMVSVVAASDCGTRGKAEKAQSAGYTEAKMEMDIVETAVAADNFTTLVAAVKAAGLVEALKSDGPFTVFAPTDEAFAELPEGTLEKLLADPEMLAGILKYHVVEGAVNAETAASLDAAQTLNGQSIKITSKDKRVMINDAEVIATDIFCSNGVIHVLDRVILPPAEAK